MTLVTERCFQPVALSFQCPHADANLLCGIAKMLTSGTKVYSAEAKAELC